MEKNKFVESKIFNVNETQISIVWKPVIFLGCKAKTSWCSNLLGTREECISLM